MWLMSRVPPKVLLSKFVHLATGAGLRKRGLLEVIVLSKKTTNVLLY
jgi:hypothetical protein